MKVKALNTYKVRSIADKNLGFIPEEGYEFEVDEERAKVLMGENPYGLCFVKEVKKRGRKKKEDVIVEEIIQ